MNKFAYIVLTAVLIGSLCTAVVRASGDDDDDAPQAREDLGRSREGGRTDSEAVQREEEAIKLDGLNVAQMREMRDKSEKHVFQAEVDRMMKLIINSLYKNKEIFLRELISNASDALDKVRFLALTDQSQLAATEELTIRIRANAEARTLHIIDTGVGMTHDELVKNLGTIAKSGTSDFFEKYTSATSSDEAQSLIGQFGVGFYSAFLVAEHVTVVSKHNDDEQYIWESDTRSFTVIKDPRGTTLKRGTEVILRLKEEASEFLETEKLKELVHKYSQFMNFNIYLWTKKTEMVDEPVDEEAVKEDKPEEEDEARVEEEKKDEAKTKKVEKTTWDWELLNDTKPIWTRKTTDVTDEEYTAFYKAITKDTDAQLAHQHFKAEGEVSFTSILYVPQRAPQDLFQNYGKLTEAIKLYVRRVFITDQFDDMLPKYLSFVRGIVDSDDLPLNVSRETLQQNKLLKVIKKKLVRKILDMIKKLKPEDFDKFWKEFSTNLKLGVIEDQSNRTRLANLLRFKSSFNETGTTLTDYVARMKEKQTEIYYVAGNSMDEVKRSPFVEKLLRRGFEVLYLTEAVDEYCINALPEFETKKFVNVAKEDLKMAGADSAAFKERRETLEKEFKPLTDWLKDNALHEKIDKAVLSDRLADSPCALVASQYGWTGNMERIMRSQAYAKQNDAATEYYLSQKKTLEINPRHPIIKELLRRVHTDPEERSVKDLAYVMFETAALRSGYVVRDAAAFGDRVERMMRLSLDVPVDEKVEEDPLDAEFSADAQKADTDAEVPVDADDDHDHHGHHHEDL